MIRLFAILLALWCSAAQAQVRASIAGPRTVARGQLVKLDATDSGAERYRWILMKPALTDEDYIESGPILGFAAGWNGVSEHQVILVVWNQEPFELDVLPYLVTVEGVTPPTPVPPGPTPPGPNPPNPPPGPVLPDGTYKFARLAYDLALQVPASSRGKSKALAANFDAVASAMAAGVFADLKAALTDLTSRNQATLGADRDAWLPWFQRFSDEQGRIYDAGGRLPEFSVAYREIAMGLRAVP